MRAVLDACVLYPTVLREILIGAAGAGLFQPVWSARILAEWRHAAARLGPAQADVAGAEIALLSAAWPQAEVPGEGSRAAGHDWPDPADRHVAEAALALSPKVGWQDGVLRLAQWLAGEHGVNLPLGEPSLAHSA